LTERQSQIVSELTSRGYQLNFTTPLSDTFADIPESFWGKWIPDGEALNTNRQRIQERLSNK